MKVTDEQITSIVDKVVKSITTKSITSAPTTNLENSGLGSFNDVNSAASAAKQAFLNFQSTSLETRRKIISAIRKICLDHLEDLSRIAIEETGLGRYDDKLAKNKLAIMKTPGVEDIESEAVTGDNGLTLMERSPFGVIGSITPCTNPSETIISNGIGMIAAGNSVIFNPHPSAKKVSIFTTDLLNKAVLSEGGPANLFTTVANPTIESAQQIMNHPLVNLLVVTGGPAVVSAAMKSGKRVIAAGPGNPPVVVDDTADLDKAGKDIVMSASTDNNIICVVEKEIIVTPKSVNGLKESLKKHGAVELSQHQTKRLEKVIFDEHNHVRKQYVGKNIQVILKEIGLDVDDSKRLAFSETSANHPFATTELLMPVIPLIKATDIDNAIEIAYKLEKGCFHTAVIHSKNIDNMHKMARRMNTSIFVKNGPALAGLGLFGEGPATFTIASPTGEGCTTPKSFTRLRRCVLKDYFGNI